MNNGFDRWLERELDAGVHRLRGALPHALYTSTPRAPWRTTVMAALSTLPASLSVKAVTGVAAAALAAGGAAAVVTTSGPLSHHSATTPSATPTASSEGRAANAEPGGAHGDLVTDAVHSCKPAPTSEGHGRGIGACVSAVASGGRARSESLEPSEKPEPSETPESGSHGSPSAGAAGDDTSPTAHPTPTDSHGTDHSNGQPDSESVSASTPSSLPTMAGPPTPPPGHEVHKHSGH